MIRFEPNKHTIIQGDDVDLAYFPFEPSGAPMSLSGHTQVTVQFKGKTGPITINKTSGVLVTLTSGPAIIRAQLTKAQTADLESGPAKNVEIHIDYGSNRRSCQVKGLLTVLAQVFENQ